MVLPSSVPTTFPCSGGESFLSAVLNESLSSSPYFTQVFNSQSNHPKSWLRSVRTRHVPSAAIGLSYFVRCFSSPWSRVASSPNRLRPPRALRRLTLKARRGLRRPRPRPPGKHGRGAPTSAAPYHGPRADPARVRWRPRPRARDPSGAAGGSLGNTGAAPAATSKSSSGHGGSSARIFNLFSYSLS